MATPTTTPEPGCFGKWRAGWIVSVNNERQAGFSEQNASDFLSARRGDNASINAGHRAVDCA